MNTLGVSFLSPRLQRPFTVTETANKYDIMATVKGGGKSAQVDALVHGISRALQEMDSELRLALEKSRPADP